MKNVITLVILLNCGLFSMENVQRTVNHFRLVKYTGTEEFAAAQTRLVQASFYPTTGYCVVQKTEPHAPVQYIHGTDAQNIFNTMQDIWRQQNPGR